MGEPSGESNEQLNALGLPIELCCQDPVTGFFRDGHCHTGPHDHGLHTVCALMTEEFLTFFGGGRKRLVDANAAVWVSRVKSGRSMVLVCNEVAPGPSSR